MTHEATVEAALAPSPSDSTRPSWGRIALYSLPGSGVNFMENLIGMFLLKFTTDVLLLAPGLVELFFGLARFSGTPSPIPWSAIGAIAPAHDSAGGGPGSWLVRFPWPSPLWRCGRHRSG